VIVNLIVLPAKNSAALCADDGPAHANVAHIASAARLINRSIVSPIAACTAAFIVGRSQMAGLTLKFKQLRVALRREDWAARVRPSILRGSIF
jgi:hypothetical protein